MVDEAAVGDGLARFLHRAGRLKGVPRTGWLDRGVPPEEAESVTFDIELERLETVPPIRVTVVEPDGKPLASCRVEGHTSPRGAGVVEG